MTRISDMTAPHMRSRVALLCGTALAGAALAGFLPSALHAQTYTIEGGTSETVNGGGGGTHPSPWAPALHLTVGDSGDGTLTVENGGEVQVSSSGADMKIGNSAGAANQGVVSVTNSSSLLSVNDDLSIGFGGMGTLNITDSGDVGAGEVFLGALTGSSGLLNIDGGSLTSQGRFYVGAGGTGYGGSGHVTMFNGATLTTKGYSRIGFGTTASGNVSVSGAGTAWYSEGRLYVGYRGQGALNIGDQGVVSGDADIYVGSNTGGAGLVTVGGAGSQMNAAGDIRVGYSGDGSLLVYNGGNVTTQGLPATQHITLGEISGSTGTLAVGAFSGDPAQTAGSFDADQVVFGDGSGQLVFNHTDTGYTFDEILVSSSPGNGEILHEAGETMYGGAGHSFDGTTTVSGGTFRVNGHLNGSTHVTGGRLGGTGFVETVTTAAGGTLAPGNSIDTLQVTDATFDSGSTYEVELNNGGFVAGTNNDLLDAIGTVTIDGGTVHVTPENGTDDGSGYTPGAYTIIDAISAVTGTFDSISDDYAFLDFGLEYTPSQVLLSSSLVGGGGGGACPTGLTFNQGETCGGVLSLGSGDAVHDAVIMLSNADTPGALDSLSGEIHATAKTALLEGSRLPREAARGRLRGTGAGGDTRQSGGTGLWGRGTGSWSNRDGDGNAAAFDRSTGGLILGGDALVGEELRFGVMGGYSRSNLSVDGRSSSGTADSYTLGVYGGGDWGAFSLSGGLAHSWHDLDTSRSVAFTGFSDSLGATYSARTLQAWGEAAYSFETGTTRLEPFANLAYVNLATDGFTENGGAAALTAASDTVEATFTTLGLRGETDVRLSGSDATLRGMLGWRHGFGDTPTSQMRFASGGDAFNIAGVPLAEDTLVLDAGIDVNISEGATLSLAYGGILGSGVEDHSAGLSLNMRF